jgi:hypothetical protein
LGEEVCVEVGEQVWDFRLAIIFAKVTHENGMNREYILVPHILEDTYLIRHHARSVER